jgi:hypothetical protein
MLKYLCVSTYFKVHKILAKVIFEYGNSKKWMWSDRLKDRSGINENLRHLAVYTQVERRINCKIFEKLMSSNIIEEIDIKLSDP